MFKAVLTTRKNRIAKLWHQAILVAVSLGLFLFPNAWAHNVGQSQTSKFFAPQTVQVLKDRASGVLPGGPGIRAGDVLSYIIESVPAPNGATLGSAGYITDYIPPGTEVVGASFVRRQPAPGLPGGFDYVDTPMPLAGILADGFGPRGTNGYVVPFLDGRLAQGTQDTGIFYSADPRTARLTLPIDITACTKAALAGTQLAFLVDNLWDYQQFIAFGNNKNCAPVATVPATPNPRLIVGGTGRGTPPVYTVGVGIYAGLASPVAGPQTYYTNDYHPVGAVATLADFASVGPWQRIYYPGSRIGGTGPVLPALLAGVDTLTAVPTSLGVNLSTVTPLPPATNAVRWAIGERAVGGTEYVKISIRVTNLAAFAAGNLAPVPGSGQNYAPGYTNQSSVYGGDASGGAQGGKDLVYAYLGPSQANNNAQLIATKAVIATALTAAGPWTASDGSFVAPGAFVKYRLTYLNGASAPLYNVIVKDTVDTVNATYTVNSGTTGNPYIGTPTYLAPNLSWPVIPVLQPGAGGTMEMVVQIKPAAPDPTTANTITATACIVAGPCAVPTISSASSALSTISAFGATPVISHNKTVIPSAASNVAPSNVVTYTMTLQNTGGLLSQPVQGDVSPATGGGGIGLVVGDTLPRIPPANALPAITYTAAPASVVQLVENSSGAVCTLALTTNYTINTAFAGLGHPYWIINTYPSTACSDGVIRWPVAGTRFTFDPNYTLRISFTGTVAPAATPGVYYNQMESYVGTWDAAKGKAGKDIDKTTPGLAPVSINSPGFLFQKTATDINGGVVAPGDNLRYNLSVTNTGTAPATNVVITDPIPTGFTDFVVGSALAPGATISYSSDNGLTFLYVPVGITDPLVTHIRFTYPTLAMAAVITPSFDVQIPPTVGNGTQINNQANLTSTQTGLTTFNSDDPATPTADDATRVTVVAAPDFSTSSKTALVNGLATTTIHANDVVSYSVTVTESGNEPSGASNVVVTDTVDLTVLQGVTVSPAPLGWVVGGPDVNGLITWTAATLAQGATATFTITGMVKPAVANGTTLNNSFTLDSLQTTPVTVNAPTLTVPNTVVTGTVFNDLNSNGTLDGGEPLLQNVTVALQVVGSGLDTVVATTDANGFYSMIAPSPGNWDVRVTDSGGVLAGYTATSANPISPVNLPGGITTANQNFGFHLNTPPATINGRVYDDANGNALQDGGEAGLGNVTVELRNAGGTVVATALTNGTGDYSFTNLAAGNYTVHLTDTNNVLSNRYLTTGNPSPIAVTLGGGGSVNLFSGYRLGAQIGDLIFADSNVNGIFDAGDNGIANVTVALKQGAATLATATTNLSGNYLFQGVRPGTYQVVVTDTNLVLTGFVATTALVSPATVVIAAADNLAVDFGYNALPAIAATKTVTPSVAGYNEAVQYTITVRNTGGAAKNFVLTDILPNIVPPVTVPPYTASPSNFQYLSTLSTTLNGAPFVVPGNPTFLATQPQWSGFTLPAASTLVVTFTAFTGAVDGVHYNGVKTQYNNGILAPTVQNFPDLATVTITTAGTISKAVTAVNGVPWVSGTPNVIVGDVVTYRVTLQNSPAAVATALAKLTDTIPSGFSYVPLSTVVTAPVNQPLVQPVPTQVGQVLTWNMPGGVQVVPPAAYAVNTFPSTASGATPGYPGIPPTMDRITVDFRLLVGATAPIGNQTDLADATVTKNTGGVGVLLSTGPAAPVNVTKPALAIAKTTTTTTIGKSGGVYAPAHYQVTLANSGSAAALGVVLSDVLPAGFSLTGTPVVRLNGTTLLPAAYTVTQVGQTVTLTSNPPGGFTVAATTGTLVFEYDAAIAPGTAAGTYNNSATATASNVVGVTGPATVAVTLVNAAANKSTSTPMITPGSIATYSITVQNSSLVNPLNNVVVTDTLPGGFTYRPGSTLINAVAAPDPGGTAAQPQWSIASVAANSTTTITFSADVGAGVSAGVYYNVINVTANGTPVPGPGPTAGVMVVNNPLITFLKTVSIFSDPVNGTTNPKFIPGALAEYTLIATNSGSAADNNSIVITDPLPANTALFVNDIGAGLPVLLTDGVTPSGITLPLLAADIDYFGGSPVPAWGYIPVAGADGCDPLISQLRINPKGTFAGSATPPSPSFNLKFRVCVK
ncbi:MAG: beta strand repeat-containing protein [Pseudomonadota bacterium]